MQTNATVIPSWPAVLIQTQPPNSVLPPETAPTGFAQNTKLEPSFVKKKEESSLQSSYKTAFHIEQGMGVGVGLVG